MRWWLAAAIGCSLAGPAWADDWVAIKPGIMCKSADALGRLTLPSGDSRTHGAAANAADRGTATAGGCVDITPGLHVSTVETYRNTSVAIVGGARLTIPNVDFQPAPATVSGAIPVGYTVATRIPLEDGRAVELLRDSRISAQLMQQLWGGPSDPDDINAADLPAFLNAKPPLHARVRFIDQSDAVLAEQALERPLAKLEHANWRGLPTPTLLLTVDYSIGMGSYAGPTTTLLTPAVSGLNPVTYTGPPGHSGTLELASTLKTGWQVVHSPAGGPDEILQISCRPAERGSEFTVTYQTFRLVSGSWQMTDRKVPGCWEADGFPNRSAFP